jgi:hypothetical protein
MFSSPRCATWRTDFVRQEGDVELKFIEDVIGVAELAEEEADEREKDQGDVAGVLRSIAGRLRRICTDEALSRLSGGEKLGGAPRGENKSCR